MEKRFKIQDKDFHIDGIRSFCYTDRLYIQIENGLVFQFDEARKEFSILKRVMEIKHEN